MVEVNHSIHQDLYILRSLFKRDYNKLLQDMNMNSKTLTVVVTGVNMRTIQHGKNCG